MARQIQTNLIDQAENLFLVKDEKPKPKPEPKAESRKPKRQNDKMTKWTEAKVLELIEQARKLGSITAADKLAELQNAGPKYSVHDENRNNKCVGTMLDVCGFANIKISARSKFFQIAKKLSATGDYRFYCTAAYRGGGRLSIFDSNNPRQEMSVNKAACVGQAKVLNSYGIETSITTRID